MNSAIPKPEKFDSMMNIDTYFKQFELFLRLAKIEEAEKGNVLLSYLDYHVFEAVSSALDISKAAYKDIRKMLLERYSTVDSFVERISFFNAKFSYPPESFAAALNSKFNYFTGSAAEVREQILVSKYIASTSGDITSELQIRRPATLSDCVKITNALKLQSSSCAVHETNPPPVRKPMNSSFPQRTCFRCGSKMHIASDPKCPGANAVCRLCGKKGHFQRVCNSKKTVPDSKLQIKSVNTLFSARPKITLSIGKQKIGVIVDTGSDVSILTYNDFKRMFPKENLISDQKVLQNFDGSPIQIVGCLSSKPVSFNAKVCHGTFFVAHVPQSIIGIDIISGLKLQISFNSSSQLQSNVVYSLSMHKSKYQHLIKLRNGAPSTLIQPLRRLPFSMEDKVEAELRKLIAADVIESIESSTYVSPIVVATKSNGQIRLCVDFRQMNKYIVVDQFPIPSSEELFSRIKDAKVFSKIDLQSAYHQIELDPKSRDITAFITHLGLFRFKKLPFGLASAPAVFSRVLTKVLSGCNNTISYFDDILIYGSTQQDHDRALQKVLHQLQQYNLQVNNDKCIYNAKEVTFLGRKLSKDGITVPEDTLKAIQDIAEPTSKTEMRSLIGLLSFFRNFVKNFSIVASPLYELIKEQSVFKFGENERDALRKLKEEIKNSRALEFFNTDPAVKTVLSTDASGVGVGACLLQVVSGKEKPICFISRKLSSAEKNYSSSELEMLAVVWAVDRLRQFLYGREFVLRTDHLALKGIFSGKSKKGHSARVNRWASKIMEYKFTVEYIKGSSNLVCDALSRFPCEHAVNPDEFNFSVALIYDNKSITYSELKEATKEDQLLTTIKTLIANNWQQISPFSNELLPFSRVKDELSINEGVVLRGDKIIIPTSLQDRLLRLAHTSHMGIAKTKSRIRQNYWWPEMDKQIEEFVRDCNCCRTICRDSPVQITDWSTKPWSKLFMDIAGPKFDVDGKRFYIVGLVDDHSKYVFCKIVSSIETIRVIEVLEEAFDIFGLCNTLVTDNGVQFTSYQFSEFLQKLGIVHVKSATYNPQANGAIERVNRNFKKVLLNNRSKLNEINRHLHQYVLDYNNTCHSTTDVSPSSLLLQYTPRTNMSILLPESSTSSEIRKIQNKVNTMKEKRALYANNRRKPKYTFNFQIGDLVQKPPGPMKRIVKQTGLYTYELENGFKVNARNLKLIQRKPKDDGDFVDIPTRRYPVRIRRQPSRFGLEAGKM